MSLVTDGGIFHQPGEDQLNTSILICFKNKAKTKIVVVVHSWIKVNHLASCFSHKAFPCLIVARTKKEVWQLL